ncbi:MAG: PAS domain S-box protein [Spirochaetales bacterium]|nr:PAS domain S-box protein [Spirochaetales bacterium]
MKIDESLYRKGFEQSALAYMMTSLDGSFLKANQAFAGLLGYSNDELSALGFQKITHPEDLPGSFDLFQRMLAGESLVPELEKRYLRKDGEFIWVRLSSTLLRTEDGEPICFFSAVYDISQKKKAEAELIESERRYRLLFENMQEGFGLQEIILDSAGEPADFRFLELNAAYERHTGFSQKDSLGRTIREILPSVDPQQIQLYGHVALTGEPLVVDYHSAAYDRDFRVRAFRPSPGRFATIFEDITETRRSQLAVEAERERLATTLRSIADGVITTDEQGRVELLNAVAEEFTGWTTAQARGLDLETVFKIIHENTREVLPNPVTKVLASGMTMELANNTVLLSRDGTERIIADSAAPIRSSDGRILGVVLVFRDMTEKQRMLFHLQRSEKLESLGALAGGIAHDFNNLLTGLFSYLELAAATVSPAGPAGGYLGKALNVFERAKALTLQLLTFSKGGVPKRTTGSLETTLREVVPFALSGSNLKAQFNIAPDLALCDYDPNQMAQVIENLVVNALQAMPQGGALEIGARNIVLDPERGGALNLGPCVEVWVKDDGPGIAPHVLPRIFDPFFTTKPQGNGLGLATVYSILRQHDGDIQVETKLGSGTTFRFYLPVSKALAPSAVPKSTSTYKGHGRLLVMDDEVSIRESLAELLNLLGFQTDTVGDGQGALQLVQQAKAEKRPYRAVFMDLTIPGGLGGLGAITQLRGFEPELPVFVISGYSEELVMVSPQEYGFTDGLVKPFQMQDLRRVLARNLK